MKTTVADLEARIGNMAPGGYTFRQALSLVMERYYNAGVWKDLAAKVVIGRGSTTGFFTLPRRYLSLCGVMVDHGAPLPVYNQSHEWAELSLGYVAPNELTMRGVIDMGDGYCTTADIATEGTMRFKIYNANDANKIVRLFGTGTVNSLANKRIYSSNGDDGITLTTANSTADTTQTFDNVTDIALPANMLGRSALYVVNSGVETLLGEYEPGETRPCYRRYKLGVVDSDLDVLGYCRLRFIDYRSDTDFVVPANSGAILAGFQAIIKENAQQYTEAAKIWAFGEELLQLQLRATRGSAKPSMPMLGKELTAAPSSVR